MGLTTIMRATLRVYLCLGVIEHPQPHFDYQVGIVFANHIPIFVVLDFGLFGTEV